MLMEPTTKIPRRGRLAVAALLATLLISGVSAPANSQSGAKSSDLCAGVNLAKAPDKPVVIRYGSSGGGEEPLAILWTDKIGYPNDGKLYTIEPTSYTPTDRMTAFQAGQIDAGTISLPSLIVGVNAGIGLRAVASLVEVTKGDNEGAFVALDTSSIHSIKDLKGKRIGYYGPNTTSEFWVKSMITRAGINPSDVSFVALPPPAQEQALRNHQVDVAWLARQFLADGKAVGGIHTVLTPYEAAGMTQPNLVVFFSPAFVQAHQQAYCAWRTDYQRAMRAWIANPNAAYPKLIAAKYVTPMAPKAGADAGRDADCALSLAELTATMKDMIDSTFLPPAMLQPARQLVLTGYALTK
jgi:ABC-type nitrate/sulfonate/bicarbonate transport system substrate-binding protein